MKAITEWKKKQRIKEEKAKILHAIKRYLLGRLEIYGLKSANELHVETKGVTCCKEVDPEESDESNDSQDSD